MSNPEKIEEIEKDTSDKNQTKPHHIDKYMNSLNSDMKSSMKNRVLIGAMLVLIVVPCLIVGNFVFAALIALASIISCHEIINTPQSVEKKFSVVLYIFAYYMMLTLIFWPLLKNNLALFLEDIREGSGNFVFDLTQDFKGPTITLSSFFICVSLFFLSVLFQKNFTINSAFYFIGMLLIVSVGFQSILYLRYIPFYHSGILVYDSALDFRYGQSMLLIFFMLMGTCLNDVGAYFIGVLFGKHKMSPRISPKKTWEGFIGGVVVSLISTLTFALVLDFCGVPILKGVLDIEHWYNVLILSLVIPIFATFGDLLFSSIKRFFNIKDFGKALQSHGGILDRIDSILIVSIVVSLLVEVMISGWTIF